MRKWIVPVIALALSASGSSSLAGPYGYYPPGGPSDDLGATPNYVTVYVDESGYIVGTNVNGPVTPRIARSTGGPFLLEMLPRGAMSFGSIRVVPTRRAFVPPGY